MEYLSQTILFIFLTLFAFSSTARAGGIYTVDRFDDDAGASDCQDSTANDCSLRGAIVKANQDNVNSVVLLPGGLYELTIAGPDENSSLTGDLDVNFHDLTLQAASGHPVIRQLTNDRIIDIDFSAGDIEILGPITFLDGVATNTSGQSRGGSLNFFRADSLMMTDVHFVGGSATDFAGCFEWAGPVTMGFLTLIDVSFTGCATEGTGGAFFIQTIDSPVHFNRVSVRQNTASVSAGGGFFSGGTTAVFIENSNFVSNIAGTPTTNAWGGGLYLTDGTYNIHRSTISRNRVGQPGGPISTSAGLHLENSMLWLKNSTISHNESLAPSSTSGSEMTLGSSSTASIEFSTIKSSGSEGTESIYARTGTTIDFFSSILEGDCSGSGSISSSGFNVEHPLNGATSTECLFNDVSDVFTVSPLLKPLAGYGGPTPTHALLPSGEGTTLIVSSPNCPVTDQRSAPRNGLFCHSGAYEANSEAPGKWIFSDSFESGSTDAWSSASSE